MQDDRTRLAVELDSSIARTASLELANDEVTKRLRNVGVTIQVILEKAYSTEK